MADQSKSDLTIAELREIHVPKMWGVFIGKRLHKLSDLWDSLLDRVEQAENKLARLPADWEKDSSLESWFPLTAETLKRLQSELELLRKEREEHVAWLRYVRHSNGSTTIRTCDQNEDGAFKVYRSKEF
jgi:hypothetical protein